MVVCKVAACRRTYSPSRSACSEFGGHLALSTLHSSNKPCELCNGSGYNDSTINIVMILLLLLLLLRHPKNWLRRCLYKLQVNLLQSACSWRWLWADALGFFTAGCVLRYIISAAVDQSSACDKG